MQKIALSITSRSFILSCTNQFKASFDCDNCHKKIAQPQCNACHKMVNYFKVFNIPQNYKVDANEITKKAKNLQKQFHPDKHNNQQQEYNADYSSYINSAKSTLLNDLKRAQYLLSLRGINIDQQTTIHDNQFMMDMFQLQQQVQQAKTVGQVRKLQKRIEDILDVVKADINRMFQKQNNQRCVQFVHKYRYLYSALTNLKKKHVSQA